MVVYDSDGAPLWRKVPAEAFDGVVGAIVVVGRWSTVRKRVVTNVFGRSWTYNRHQGEYLKSTTSTQYVCVLVYDVVKYA